MDETNPDWAPTLHLGCQSDQGAVSRLSARYVRHKDRAGKKAAAVAASVAFCQISGDEEPSTDCDMGSELERHSSPEIATMGSRSRAGELTGLFFGLLWLEKGNKHNSYISYQLHD